MPMRFIGLCGKKVPKKKVKSVLEKLKKEFGNKYEIRLRDGKPCVFGKLTDLEDQKRIAEIFKEALE
ncbi:MAG: hypothetical protein AB1779_10260 [Candidatus Thermoplasmatota archaeon]